MKLTKFNIALISVTLMVILAFTTLFSISSVCANEIPLEDGRYEVEFESSMPTMGLGAFENKAKKGIVEKVGNKYFLTLSFNHEKVSDISLDMKDGKPGVSIVNDGLIQRHTFSILKKYIDKELNLSMFVKKMNKRTSITILLNLADAKRIGDVDISVDRPAEFVPVIDTVASDNELEKDSQYMIPPATAKICDDKLNVLITAYYINNNEKISIDVDRGFIKLSKVGEYHVIYRAESDKYKTLNGNNTVTELDVTLMVKIGATSIVKLDEGVLTHGESIQSNYIKDGNIYNNAKAHMTKISDNFEVISFTILDKNGNPVILEQNINVYLICNDSYNRKKVEVYYLNDSGNIINIPSSNFGKYVKVNVKNTGNYIVCQKGVAFHMPMWAIALLTLLGVSVVIGGIVVMLIVLVKKKKGKSK